MATYQTEQKKELLDFLRRNSERSFTIEEIVSAMEQDLNYINPPGKSTIYRLMPKLAEEKLVKCFAKDKGRKNTYQIMDGHRCCHHMHMKCTCCGKLFHMSSEESQNIMSHIHTINNFDVDMEQTLIFGKCSKCR